LNFNASDSNTFWYGIPASLRSSGATVYVTQQSAVNSAVTRGEQLISQLKALQAIYGYTKFNLVGHSQGGLVARYVASVAPELVASVTTAGTPHQGSDVATAVNSTNSVTKTAIAAVVTALAKFVAWINGDSNLPQNAMAMLGSLTSSGAATFNASYPEGAPTTSCGSGSAKVNGIYYYSMGGTSSFTNALDYVDYALALTSAFFNGGANDGVVGRCSNHWGTVLKDNYAWNHLDLVNQSYGLRGLFSPDPKAFYRSQANRLQGLGL
jgi:triacylglycerol lipase